MLHEYRQCNQLLLKLQQGHVNPESLSTSLLFLLTVFHTFTFTHELLREVLHLPSARVQLVLDKQLLIRLILRKYITYPPHIHTLFKKNKVVIFLLFFFFLLRKLTSLRSIME